MSAARNTLTHVTVLGSGPSAWLTACVLARFVKTRDMTIDLQAAASSDSAAADSVLIRYEMIQLHRSLGLDLTKLPGAKQVNRWQAGTHGIQLAKPGAPLKGVDFEHILARSGHATAARSLLDYAPATPVYALAVPSTSYLEALKRIAPHAGVTTAQPGASANLTIITEPQRGSMHDAWTDDRIHVGPAAIPLSATAAMSQYTTVLSLIELVATWPTTAQWDLDRQEYTRRVKAIATPFRHMEELLSTAGPQDPLVAHRIRVWEELSRIIPVDHDPYTAGEWMSALSAMRHQQRGYHVMAETLSHAEMQAHITHFSKGSQAGA